MESKEWMTYLSEHYEELQIIYDQGKESLAYFMDSLKKDIEERIQQFNEDSNLNDRWKLGKIGSGKNENGCWIQVFYDNWNDYRIHYEFLFPEATSGFLIPKIIQLNLDIEDKNVKSALKMEPRTELLKKELKFKTEDELDFILDEFFEKLKDYHNENHLGISKNLASFQSEK